MAPFNDNSDSKEPERTLKDLLSWLDLPWDPKVLSHQVEALDHL